MSQAGRFNFSLTSGVVDFLEGTSGGPVGPNGSNIIFLEGAGVITVAGNPLTNTLTISNTGASAFFRISTNTLLAVNTGYACVGGGILTVTLPVVSAIGDFVEITLDGSTSFMVLQGAGQSIRMGNKTTTSGVGGSLTTTAQGDTVFLRCTQADVRWNVMSSMGNPIVV